MDSATASSKSADLSPKDGAADSDIDLDEYVHAKSEWRQLFSLAWPVSLTLSTRVIMAVTDLAFLGYLGTEYLAAAGLAYVIMDATRTFTWSASDVLYAFCSQAYGAKNYKLVSIWLQLGLIFQAFLCVFLTLIWVFATDDLLILFGNSHERASLAQTFARYSALWLVPGTLFNTVLGYFQAQQISKPGLVASVAFIGVNVGFNYLFIFTLDMGYLGSPLATFLSRTLQVWSFLVYTVQIKGLHKKTWTPWSLKNFTKARIKSFLKMYIPTMIGFAMEDWQFSVITLFTGWLSEVDIAVQSALFNVFFCLHSMAVGFGQAVNIRVGNFLGAGKPVRAKQACWVGHAIAAGLGAICAVVFYLLRDYVGHIFSRDPDVIDLVSRMAWLFAVNFEMAALLVVGIYVIMGQGRAHLLPPFILLCSWCLNIPLAYVFAFTLHKGLHGIWYGTTVGYWTFLVGSLIVLAISKWDDLSQKARQRSEVSSDDPASGADSAVEAVSMSINAEEHQTVANEETPLLRSNSGRHEDAYEGSDV